MLRTSITGALASLALLASGATTAAHRTEIINRVNVSAVSGDNRGGTVSTGDASARAKIKTVVNGERVESISIEAKATAGEEKVEQHIATSTENGTLRIETTVEVKAHAATTSTATTTSQATTKRRRTSRP